MKMTYKIMVWEVMRNLKNKQFLIGLIITPLIFALFSGAPTLLERFDSESTAVFLITDQLGVSEYAQQIADGYNLEFQAVDKTIYNEEEIKSLLQKKGAEGYFILDQEFIDSGQINIFTEEEQLSAANNIENILTEILQKQRLAEEGMAAETFDYLTAQTRMLVSTIGEDVIDSQERFNNIALAMALGVFVLILLMGSGSMLLMSAMQEKRDRMSEVILSSVSSDDLMAGKIFGHFILGIIQLLVWGLLALPAAWYFFDIEIGQFLLRPILALLLLFGLLGYFMFAALFVGIGATMDDMQSASNTQGMVFMLPWLPVIFIGPIFSNPGGIIAQVASIFPLT
ncbi:MAG: ABC transporter permease, partial [Halanaerobiales bacterium]